MYRGTLKLVLLSWLIIPFGIIISQPLQFSKETIEIKIYDGYAIVTGSYTFNSKGKDALTRTLFYPFPVNEYSYPDSILVSDKNDKTIPFSKSTSGIYFSIKVYPDSETTIQVNYLQRISTHEMKYILTSTQQWKRPLQKADYKIVLPKEFELKTLSFNPDKKDSDSTHNFYYITKENFMPEKDLIVNWARRENVK